MGEIVVTRYKSELQEKWNQFVVKSKNALFLFDRAYMDYHKSRFLDNSLVFWNEDDIVALLPANIKGDILISHGGLTYGGLLVDNNVKQHTVNDCIDVLIKYAKEAGINKIIYKPIPHIFHQQPSEEDLYGLFSRGAKLKEVAASTVINLKGPLKMPKGRKAQISKAKREGVEVQVLNSEKDYKEFINLENEVLKSRHGVKAVHTAEELYLLHSRFPDKIHLFGAIYERNLIGGTVVFEYEDAVHTQYMASSEIGRSIGALDIVISEVINHYRDSKRWLDFGISTENHGTFLNEGLISQKESFGGRTNIYAVLELHITEIET